MLRACMSSPNWFGYVVETFFMPSLFSRIPAKTIGSFLPLRCPPNAGHPYPVCTQPYRSIPYCGEIQHQQKRRVGVGESDVLAVAGHVQRRRVEEERVGVDPGLAVPGFKLREGRRLRRIWRHDRRQQVSLQRVGAIDGLAAVAVGRPERRRMRVRLSTR